MRFVIDGIRARYTLPTLFISDVSILHTPDSCILYLSLYQCTPHYTYRICTPGTCGELPEGLIPPKVSSVILDMIAVRRQRAVIVA